MKIRIETNERSFSIPLPTGLIFSSGSAWILQHLGNKYARASGMDDPDFVLFDFSGHEGKEISPDAMKRLFAELRRIKKRYGSWELVDVQSSGGQHIRITL